MTTSKTSMSTASGSGRSKEATASDVCEGTIEANGIRFAFLEAGRGPLVLLLHGFPDNPWTWSHQIPALVEAGYRVVAPWMRGYAPTQVPADGRYDAEALGTDVAELIRTLGGGSAYVVGHDWGTVAAYTAMALFPETIKRAVMIAGGHPTTLTKVFGSPSVMHHIFHFYLFQVRGFGEIALQLNDFALVDYLWHHWSPGHQDPEQIARAKATLSTPGTVEAALGYYRALATLRETHPQTAARMRDAGSVPTLAVFGVNDPPHVLSEGEESSFSAEYRRVIVEGAGHFVHRERPEELTRLVLDWLAADVAMTSQSATP